MAENQAADFDSIKTFRAKVHRDENCPMNSCTMPEEIKCCSLVAVYGFIGTTVPNVARLPSKCLVKRRPNNNNVQPLFGQTGARDSVKVDGSRTEKEEKRKREIHLMFDDGGLPLRNDGRVHLNHNSHKSIYMVIIRCTNRQTVLDDQCHNGNKRK